MNERLFQIIVDSIAFLALSDDDTIDQDAAVEQLEHIAASLKELARAQRDEFLAFIDGRARHAREAGDGDHAEFLESLPDELGLRE